MRHQSRDRVCSNEGIRIDADEKLGVADVLDSIIERFCFARVLLSKDENLAGCGFCPKRIARYFKRRSLEPSSITMTRRLGNSNSRPRALFSRSPSLRCRQGSVLQPWA